MNETTRLALGLLYHHLQCVRADRTLDPGIKAGLDLAMEGLHQAFAAAAADLSALPRADHAIARIPGALAELQRRLETHGTASANDPTWQVRFLMADLLLAQACDWLSHD